MGHGNIQYNSRLVKRQASKRRSFPPLLLPRDSLLVDRRYRSFEQTLAVFYRSPTTSTELPCRHALRVVGPRGTFYSLKSQPCRRLSRFPFSLLVSLVQLPPSYSASFVLYRIAPVPLRLFRRRFPRRSCRACTPIHPPFLFLFPLLPSSARHLPSGNAAWPWVSRSRDQLSYSLIEAHLGPRVTIYMQGMFQGSPNLAYA